MTIEERLDQAEKLVAEVKAELAAMRATKPRNWPERIEAGMVFQSPGTTATWMATDVDGLFVCLKGETDSFKAAGRTMRLERDNVPHAGHARDILTIRTDAHEPTGAELVGILEDIRNVSNNPGRTLTTLGLAECLQSCNVMARNALDGIAR